MLVMLEFQSRDDPGMALRVLEYTAMLYRELLREDWGGAPLPPVLPVVLYNGHRPWRSGRRQSAGSSLPRASASSTLASQRPSVTQDNCSTSLPSQGPSSFDFFM